MYEFSAAKSYAELVLMSNKLIGEDGKPRTYADFKKEVDKLNIEYNRNHLATERINGIGQARMAEQWQRIQSRKHLFPNLQYYTAGDDHVRQAHAALNGLIYPVDHSIWNSIYPKNGHRCRCGVKQTNKPASTGDVPTLSEKDHPKQFRSNVGKTGVVFSKKHPYFENLPKANTAFSRAIEEAKRRSPAYVGYTSSNGSVLVSPFGKDADFKANYASAVKVVDGLKKDIKILPNALDGNKNPEYLLDGIVGDRVKPVGKSVETAVENTFKEKYGKGGQLAALNKSFLLMEFGKLSKTEKQLLARKLNGRMNAKGRNDFVVVQWSEGIVQIMNDENRSFKTILEALKVK